MELIHTDAAAFIWLLAAKESITSGTTWGWAAICLCLAVKRTCLNVTLSMLCRAFHSLIEVDRAVTLVSHQPFPDLSLADISSSLQFKEMEDSKSKAK